MSNMRGDLMRVMADASTIGITMAACIFIGVGVGYYLDNKVFHGSTSPWLLLIFTGYGIIAAFLSLFRLVKKKEMQNQPPKDD
ncbi:MAG: AtpZ/AtpI family protein [Desulfobulbaceae bacterium]|nr:AtpZ/AtpI family protein [Desulfobulbaceae bacterium]MCK5437487.1 AtpZ/AtpI family protein [Desulfobulbaceae bacterium]MCK5544879.1 AtpZ/AtpI family protein [Desulfobulbaceae bacterium]